MLPPLPRCSGWASSSLVSPNRVSLPRFHVRIGLHIVLFEACLAFTCVAACTLARSPYIVTAIRRLQTLRLLHACSGRFRLERSPGGACTHWKSAALSRRTWIMGFATDNGKALGVQVNGSAGEKILLPAGGGTSSSSISLATNQNYEYVALPFDGSDYRVVAAA